MEPLGTGKVADLLPSNRQYWAGDNYRTENQQSSKLASGYSANRQHWDGTFWRTEKNAHTDQVRTLYRLKFDQPKPF